MVSGGSDSDRSRIHPHEAIIECEKAPFVMARAIAGRSLSTNRRIRMTVLLLYWTDTTHK